MSISTFEQGIEATTAATGGVVPDNSKPVGASAAQGKPVAAASCCPPSEQATCCEPAAKASCCGAAAAPAGSCGCR